MSFAAVLYIDRRTSNSIEKIWRQQAEENISRFILEQGYLPHITLGACEDLALEECEDELVSFAAGIEPFTVEMPYIGLFPHKNGAVFLGGTATEQLLAFQKAFHDMFGRQSATINELFAPGKWIPHCTLAYHGSPEKDLRAVQISMGLSLPIVATCDRLAVIEFPPWQERLAVPLGRRARS